MHCVPLPLDTAGATRVCPFVQTIVVARLGPLASMAMPYIWLYPRTCRPPYCHAYDNSYWRCAHNKPPNGRPPPPSVTTYVYI